MSRVNTVDLIGDETLAGKIIDKSIVEIVDSVTKTISASVFSGCSSLVTADFLAVTSIQIYAFSSCNAMKTLVLRSGTMCDGYASNIFLYAPGPTHIYVPAALLEDYKTNAGWTSFADRFRALEDYTVDGTTTGELDPTKI